MSCTKLRKYHRRILKFAKPAALPAAYVLFWPPWWRPYELEGFEFCYWTTQDDSESQIAIRKGYSNCGFPENMWTTHQIRHIARHRPPHPKKNWKFRHNEKNPGFFLQTHDLLEKTGIFPQVTGKPGVCIRTREISRVQKVRVYIYTCICIYSAKVSMSKVSYEYMICTTLHLNQPNLQSTILFFSLPSALSHSQI